MQVVINAINEFAQEAGKPKWDWQPPVVNKALEDKVAELVKADLTKAYQIADKKQRSEEVNRLFENTVAELVTEEEDSLTVNDLKDYFEKLSKEVVRVRILDGHPRIDGRDTRTVRQLATKVGVLPRTHGSALFTRGETQAMVVTTLGTGSRDAQIIDALMGEYKDAFMLHYNFPPYCVGETGFMSGPKRREIGHGCLARRGIKAVLPTKEEFPYVIRSRIRNY